MRRARLQPSGRGKGLAACPTPSHSLEAAMIEHDYTHDASYGQYIVKTSPSTGRGYFQHFTSDEKHDLRFSEGVLVDTSARYLPRDVTLGLKAAGFVVPG